MDDCLTALFYSPPFKDLFALYLSEEYLILAHNLRDKLEQKNQTDEQEARHALVEYIATQDKAIPNLLKKHGIEDNTIPYNIAIVLILYYF